MMEKNKNHKPQHGKRGFRFNIVDLILLLIILAASAAMVYLLLPAEIPGNAQPVSKEVRITYTLFVEKLPATVQGNIRIGDAVTDTADMRQIGLVSDVSYSESVFAGVDQLVGEYVYSELPGYIDVTVKVDATAVKTASGITVDGFTVAVGKQIPFRVPGFTGTAVCTVLEEYIG